MLEWECCIKSAEQGAAEGAPFIARHIIQAASTTFDDFASSGADQAANRRMLGLASMQRVVRDKLYSAGRPNLAHGTRVLPGVERSGILESWSDLIAVFAGDNGIKGQNNGH